MNLFGFGEASTQDVYDTIAEHGFRLVGPLMRNGEVYVADVIDRRQRRERLIISRSDAQIVQRFFVDLNGQSRGTGAPLPGATYGGAPPQSAPVARNDSDFFSRLTRGWGGDDAPPRPPAPIDNGASDAVMPPTLPRQQRIVRTRPPDMEPRLTTRREDTPITSRPLPAPLPNSVAPSDKPVTAPPTGPVASVPPPSTTAFPTAPAPSSPPPASAGPTRATVVSTDPLRIPGEREAETPKVTGAATLARQTPPIKPAAPKPAANPDVPVAPLD